MAAVEGQEEVATLQLGSVGRLLRISRCNCFCIFNERRLLHTLLRSDVPEDPHMTLAVAELPLYHPDQGMHDITGMLPVSTDSGL